MIDLGHAQAGIQLSAGYVGPRRCEANVMGAKLPIVLDSREFYCDCLSSWLDNLGEKFEVADVRVPLTPHQVGCASAVVLSVGTRVAGEDWLEQQVEWLREQRPHVSIVAVLDDADTDDDMVASGPHSHLEQDGDRQGLRFTRHGEEDLAYHRRARRRCTSIAS